MNGIIKEIAITVGESVTANAFAEEYNLTSDREYIVKGYAGDCIMVQNDLNNDEWYSLDYFREFSDRFE